MQSLWCEIIALGVTALFAIFGVSSIVVVIAAIWLTIVDNQDREK